MDQNDMIDIPADGTAPTATAGEPSAGADASSLTTTFLGELARAMQAAAERERERIAEVVAAEAAQHVEKTRKRAAAETEELRRLAEEDVERIQTWSTTEVERIRRKAERRTEQRRSDLEAYLSQHDSIIATEIEGVAAAVRDYHETLGQYFDELMAMTDPADIARRAGSLPPAPDLGAVRAAARADAVAVFANAERDAADESQGETPDEPSADAGTGEGPSGEAPASVGVMDPDAVGRSDEALEPLGEADGDAGAVSAVAPSADPLYVPADEAGKVAAASVDQSSVAARLLRAIAPWTASAGREAPDQGTRPH
jgi:hypothetical protein